MNPFGIQPRGQPLRVNFTVAEPLAVELHPAAPRLRRVLLGNGDELPPILAILQRLAQQYGESQPVRQAAELIAHPEMDMDAQTVAFRLADFVRRHVVYVPDPVGAEWVKAPPIMLEEIAARGQSLGDCDDHVLLYASLANSLGLPTRVLGVKIKGPEWDHVIASSRIGGQWRDFDLINKFGPDPFYSEKIIA